MRDEVREKLAWAADVPLPSALELWPRISPYVGWVKVGLSLFVEHGPDAVRAFREKGAKVFLDLKLHDIPNTVSLAASRAGALGAELLTVHAGGGRPMIEAAVRGAADSSEGRCRVLAVTVLTSLNEEEAARVGISGPLEKVVLERATSALEAGAFGLVCSPLEASALKKAHPESFLCTPGVRPAGASHGDQARVRTPADALRAGADLLVVGRPIHAAEDPRAAAEALHRELAAVLENGARFPEADPGRAP